MTTGEIVKIQLPIGGTANLGALVYNRDRTIHSFVPVDDDLLAMMDGEPKKFFYMQRVNDREVCFSEAPWQDW